MMKKVVALLLCVLMVIPAVAGCAKKSEDDLGAYISMYLSDQVYDLDPMNAYGNESALRVVSLIFDNLFVLNEKGKVKKSLAKDYEIVEDEKNGEYGMVITLKEAYWNDNVRITSDDVLYAWTRILSQDNSAGAAALLFDIKNARAAKEGDVSIEKVGISAPSIDEIHITFEGKIDYDQFLLNLTSYSLVPLREDKVGKSDDWAKKPSTLCTSGPFRLREVSYVEGAERLVLERNGYYFRDIEKDKIDKSVTPYRLIIDYTMTDEEIMSAYENGELFFVGDIPLSVRGSYGEDVAEIKDALSTHTYVLNQNAVIGGEKLFAKANVRKALSLAIDRDTIAKAVYYAQAATALVPYGVFDSTSKKDLFREVGGDILKSTADPSAAAALLSEAGITPSKYSFSISVPAYDDVHVKIAEMVCEAWCALGFKVTVNAIDVIVNDDVQASTGEIFKDIRDDVFAENYRAGKFEVAAIDYVAYSADAFGVLAPFAKAYTGNELRSSGQGMNITYEIPTHVSGYDSEEYYNLINSAFNEKNIKTRSGILHNAEKLLLEDLPVIPIVFNKTAMLEHKNLSKVSYTYYGTVIFTKTKLKDYLLYVPKEEETVPNETEATVA